MKFSIQPAGVKITYHEKIMSMTLHAKIKKCGPPRWPVQRVIAKQHSSRLQLGGNDGDPVADGADSGAELDDYAQFWAYAAISENMAPQLPWRYDAGGGREYTRDSRSATKAADSEPGS